MKRRFLFALPVLPLFLQRAFGQNPTKLDAAQIRPSLTIVSETVTRNGNTLTLSFTPANSFIQLFINGLQVRPNRDFLIAGNIITLNDAYNTLDASATFDVYYYR